MDRIVTSVKWVLEIMSWLIIIRSLMSFFPSSGYNKVSEILSQVTEPILAPIRSIIQRSKMGENLMFDISPLIAILIIGLIQSFL